MMPVYRFSDADLAGSLPTMATSPRGRGKRHVLYLEGTLSQVPFIYSDCSI